MSEEYLSIPSKDLRYDYWKDLRDDYWEEQSPELLFMLMRLGFNGIWQPSKKHNLYGTSSGLLNHSKIEQIFTVENLEKWKKALGRTSIQTGSYQNVVFEPRNSLIYLDPPYRGSFTSYGTGFNDEDQVELVKWGLEMKEAGAKVLLANRQVDDDNFFEKLLEDSEFHYFDVTYTAGRRKRVPGGFEAKPAREFLAVL